MGSPLEAESKTQSFIKAELAKLQQERNVFRMNCHRVLQCKAQQQHKVLQAMAQENKRTTRQGLFQRLGSWDSVESAKTESRSDPKTVETPSRRRNGCI